MIYWRFRSGASAYGPPLSSHWSFVARGALAVWARRHGLLGADRGSATAEMAVALPSLVLVLGAALWAIAAVTAQLECVDAARAGARAAARGEPLEAVRHAAGEAAPAGATVSVTRDAELSRVTISASVRPSWLIAMPAVPVGASASSATELGAGVPELGARVPEGAGVPELGAGVSGGTGVSGVGADFLREGSARSLPGETPTRSSWGDP
ncbi:TadE family type IV pilus minor pilin [Sphaerisporangium sp. NBC_01403]|uniref:TadE family type IV pilus minor pilin n=1 Tax=Sphaerisporangium sp. NBC_01403 TaxID=2903599 RepID=UPI00386AA722